MPIQVNAAHPLVKGLIASWTVGNFVKVYPPKIFDADWCSEWGIASEKDWPIDEVDQPIIVEEKK